MDSRQVGEILFAKEKLMSRLMIPTLLILILSACAPVTPQPLATPETAATPLASPPSKPAQQVPPALQPGLWSVRMTLTGGIMGLQRTLEITSDGKVTVVDERASKTFTLQLTADELTNLQTLVAESSFTAPSVPMGCADCFIYNVEIDGGSGKPFTVQVDDTSIDASGMGPLVRYLNGLIQRALK